MKNNVLNVLTKYLNTQELMSLKNEVKNEDLSKLFSYIIKEGINYGKQRYKLISTL